MSSAGELGLWRCGDELGVEASRQRAQGRHDALDVHNHRINRSCGHSQLLLEEVACDWDAVAHEDFVPGAAHSRHVDANSSLFLGQVDKLGVVGCRDDHLGEQRLMAVDYDVDLVGFQDS